MNKRNKRRNDRKLEGNVRTRETRWENQDKKSGEHGGSKKGEQERKGGGVGTTLRNRQDQVELVGGQEKIEVKKGRTTEKREEKLTTLRKQ